MRVPSPLRSAFSYTLGRWRRTSPRSRRRPVERRPDAERFREMIREQEALPHIVIITEREAKWRTQVWMRAFYGDQLTLLAPAGFRPSHALQPHVAIERLTDPSAMSHLLAARTAPTLVVDLRSDHRAHVALWQALMPHLPKGGYLAYYNDAHGDTLPPSVSASSHDVLPPTQTVVDHIAAEALGPIGDYSLHRKIQRHYLRVSEAEVPRLSRRAPGLKVAELLTLPAREVTSRTRVSHHVGAARAVAFDRSMHTPKLFVRHYAGPVRIVSQLATVHDHVMLPPSFRYPNEPDPINLAARRVGREFFALPATLEESASPIRGPLFDLNTAYHAHFGHFITEVPAKLWGWTEARRLFPDIRALIRIPVGYQPTYERELLAAYGIGENDIAWAEGPVAVDSYVAATPMWQNKEPYWVHPDIAQIWRTLRAGISPGLVSGPERLFVSRKRGMTHRDCLNAEAVEALFHAEGFTIVYPEDHTLTEQSALFRDAQIVAGFGGSAMFNILFSERLHTMIVLNHDAYVARNEHLYASVIGCESHYFWSHIERADPDGRFDPVAFQSPWEFDLASHETELRRVIREASSTPPGGRSPSTSLRARP